MATKYVVQTAILRWSKETWMLELDKVVQEWQAIEAKQLAKGDDPIYNLINALYYDDDRTNGEALLRKYADKVDALSQKIPDGIPGATRQNLLDATKKCRLAFDNIINPLAKALRESGSSINYTVKDAVKVLGHLQSYSENQNGSQVFILANEKDKEIVAMAYFGAPKVLDSITTNPKYLIQKTPRLAIRLMGWMFKTSTIIAKEGLQLTPIDQNVQRYYEHLGAKPLDPSKVGQVTTVVFSPEAIKAFLIKYQAEISDTATWDPKK